MGSYSCRAVTNQEFKTIINLLRNGYIDNNGIKHRPNNQIADILVLEANLGCRIGDIVTLKHTDFVCDNGTWKLDIREEKTGKHRTFIIPKDVKAFIDNIHFGHDKRLFSVGKPAVWKQMRIISEYLGLDRTSSHSFRKLCALNLYESTGHDIDAVCTFLQHSSPTITRAYIRRSDAALEAALDKVVSLA